MNTTIRVGRLLFGLLALIVVGHALAACGGPKSSVSLKILTADLQNASLDQVTGAIDNLYSHHPDINSFVVQSVTYTPETRDKVLKICSEGGLAVSPQDLETQKVMACAPLIFFFYYYGRQNSVPESIRVAQQLYWYAMRDKSDDSRKALNQLLQSWGIE